MAMPTLRNFVFFAFLSLQFHSPLFAHVLEIHGSNTIGASLAPLLVTEYLEQITQQEVRKEPTGNDNEQVLTTTSQQGGELSVLVAAHGSSTGFQALANGQADIWASSRPVKKAEAEQLRPETELTNLQTEHVIAIDGLAILVHPTNPVNQLSISTLRKIFSGQIQNWSELGGNNTPIQLYARDKRSGTWDTFKSLVLGKTEKLHETARRYESNDQLSDDVSRDPQAIGFSGLASVRNSKLLAISDGTAPALKPDQLTVASEDYPLSRRLYMYTMGSNSTEFAQNLIEFTLSAKGQMHVARSGFISQNPIAVKPRLDHSVPESFRRLTENYLRLTVNFRFSEGRTKLDNKARRDLLRVKHYLASNNRSTDDLLLIGFSDAQSNELRAQLISELRALSVRRALNDIGLSSVTYTGYGHYMPVGDRGNQRNGRVEVWVKAQGLTHMGDS